MKLSREQYRELKESYASEVASAVMEKTANYEDEDIKRPGSIGKHMGRGALIGAGTGIGVGTLALGGGTALGNAVGRMGGKIPYVKSVAGKIPHVPVKAALIAGGLAGGLGGTGTGAVLGGTIGAARQADASLRQRIQDKKRAAVTDQEVVEKAAELLVNAAIYKEACYQSAENAELYAEASEVALNSLGYSL